MSSNAKWRKLTVVAVLLLLLVAVGLGTFSNQSSVAGTTPAKSVLMAGGAKSGQVASLPAGSAASKVPGHAISIPATKFDVSPALRDIKPITGPATGFRTKEMDAETIHGDQAYAGLSGNSSFKDPVLQKVQGPLVMPTPILTFDGVNNRNGVLPPDTQGDVGPNHYVQWVNLSFQIWDKNGTSLYGPANGNTLWTGFGGACELTNDGDPITLYDPIADRWLMSQFAFPNYPSGPFQQCIAISSTPDPTGTWNRYVFTLSNTKLNDYPKFGVWPDAYYMTANLFLEPAESWAGTGLYAYDRTRMLAGQAATMQYFELGEADWGGMLPADLDGTNLPAAGTPEYFAEINADEWSFPGFTYYDEIQFWKFHVDWVTPANTTLTGPAHIPTAAFDGIPCASISVVNCISQPGTTVKLASMWDRGLYRLQYRKFADHESLVFNHVVDADGLGQGHAGTRWYELRNLTAAVPTIYQQGTYAPDASSRWMGSAAMDRDGNLAVGYSIGSSSMYASLAYAGRLATDPLNQLAQGETIMFSGTGSQTHSAGRWGDYSMLAVDPVDDCTFWYTNEYIQTTGSAPWRTRIGKFKFPSCGAVTPTPTATRTPGPGTPTPTVTPCAMNFSDVTPSNPFYSYIRYLYCAGAISGYADGTFRPANNVTRGQLSKIVTLAEGWAINTAGGPHFTDVAVGSTFYNYIETAYNRGVISGYADGTFRPNNDVTRGQLSKIIVLAEEWTINTSGGPHFTDVAVGSTFYNYIETAYNQAIISGYADGTFRPGNPATRGQICKIVTLAVTAP